jgi:YHS domain-containing protein
MQIHRWLIATVATAGLAVLCACAQTTRSSNTAAPAPATLPSASAKPVNKFCPVQPSNPVDDREPTYLYNGQVIGFCCPDCINEFKKNPDKYMANLK